MTNESKPNPQQAQQSGHHHDTAPEQKPISAGVVALGAAVVLIVAVILGVFGVLSRRSADTVLAERTQELAPPSVIAVAPRPGAPVDSFVLPGNVAAYTESPIYARTSGYLTRWYFDIGAKVKKGLLEVALGGKRVAEIVVRVEIVGPRFERGGEARNGFVNMSGGQ